MRPTNLVGLISEAKDTGGSWLQLVPQQLEKAANPQWQITVGQKKPRIRLKRIRGV